MRRRLTRDPGPRLAAMAPATVWRSTAVLVATFLGARFGLALGPAGSHLSPVWPSSGIAIGALWIWGYRMSPAAAAGSLLAYLAAGLALPFAMPIAAGSTAGYVIGVWLLRRVGLDPSLGGVRDVLRLAALACGVAPALGCLTTVAVMFVTGPPPPQELLRTAGEGWLGQSMGIFVVTPVILLASRSRLRPIAIRRGFEASIIAGVLGVATGSVFLVGREGLPFLIFPIAIWVALRFDQWGAALATLFVSLTALWGTLHGSGPFAAGDLTHELANLQLYLASFALTAMTLAAAISAQRRTDILLAERATLEQARRGLATAQELAGLGSWEWDLRTGRVTWSDNLYRILGLTPSGTPASPEAYLERVHGEDRDRVEVIIAAAAREPRPFEVVHRFVRPDGRCGHLHCRGEVELDDLGRPRQLRAAALDITASTEAAALQEQRRRELESSNRELEQFAYVASHDLQEPLRMVTSYVQLLQRRNAGRLDNDSDDYIGYAVEGATRMQALISDLLTFSRVGRGRDEPGPVDTERCVETVIGTLGRRIAEAGARVVAGPLPTVFGDSGELTRLFQNLIGNALKFRGEEAPVVEVSAEASNGRWLFSVRDNGIGIEPRHAEQIFKVFQRLHSRERFAGTGIGLAICRKVVEHHGGRIWVESELGRGACFRFTLPQLGAVAPTPAPERREPAVPAAG